MKKYFLFTLATLIFIAGGFIFFGTLQAHKTGSLLSGGVHKVREITVRMKKNEWRFEPNVIEANQGDMVLLTVINEDDFDHGIAINAFDVLQELPLGKTTKIKFAATKSGVFPFYCFVPCGQGMVHGKKRTHFDMTGEIHVRVAAL